ncbi:PREDICTED: granzyme B-like [Calidris pugnax]|uniref:granzyme B-like n=1 Tax=Calidris pugnax TaxID=198806 RepID=UPI00071C71FE|nr:PREDICTED: granzyme B-like [Calidris pugnax]
MLLLPLLTSAFLLVPWAGAGRIIGGSEVKPHSRPYMAYLSTGKSRCGGFLIQPDAVLSAAHCVAGKKNVTVIVTLGAHNVEKRELSQQKFHVRHWVIHPKYSQNTSENDIMLLKLKPKAKLTKKVSCISLPSDNERVKPGTKCNVAGWGRTSTSGSVSSVLREVDLEVQCDNVCGEHLKKYYRQTSMICAGDENSKKAFFEGDSGGPLVCNGKAHGIVSYRHKYSIFPEIFTRVSNFVPWIRKELRKFALQDLPDSPSSD